MSEMEKGAGTGTEDAATAAATAAATFAAASDRLTVDRATADLTASAERMAEAATAKERAIAVLVEDSRDLKAAASSLKWWVRVGVVVMLLLAGVVAAGKKVTDDLTEGQAKIEAGQHASEIRGYKNRSVSCIGLIYDGYRVEDDPECTDENLAPYYDWRAEQGRRDDRVREGCRIIEDLGATLTTECRDLAARDAAG